MVHLTKLHYACTYMYVLGKGKFGALDGSAGVSMKGAASLRCVVLMTHKPCRRGFPVYLNYPTRVPKISDKANEHKRFWQGLYTSTHVVRGEASRPLRQGIL